MNNSAESLQHNIRVHIWMPLLFALIMNHFGYYSGFIIIGLLIFTATLPLFIVGAKRLERFRAA